MKIEKLTDNKIRIILNIEELEEKNIDFLSLTKNTNETQRLFKSILKQAEKELDFHVEDCKLLIEAFVSSEGFFIITFTKIMPENDVPIGAPVKLKVKKKAQFPNLANAVYEFEYFEDFSEFCTYISNANIQDFKNLAKKISLYQYGNKYFLIFNNIDKYNKYLPLFYSSISEFAKLTSNSQVVSSRIFEYGKPIFKNNALSNGIKYFKNPV